MVHGLEIDGRELQNIRSASELTGYSRDYITKLAREQKIIASQIGRQWFVDTDSLSRYANTVAEEQRLRHQQLSEERRRERLLTEKKVSPTKVQKQRKVSLTLRAQAMATGVLCIGLGLGFLLNKMPMFDSGFNTQVASTPLLQSLGSQVSEVSKEENLTASGVVFSQESVGLSTMEGSDKGILLLPQQAKAIQNPETLFSDNVKVMVDEEGNKYIARVNESGEVVEKIPFVVVPVIVDETP